MLIPSDINTFCIEITSYEDNKFSQFQKVELLPYVKTGDFLLERKHHVWMAIAKVLALIANWYASSHLS